MTISKNPPTTFLEALLPLWRRAVEGKDGRPITDKERKWIELEMEDAAGESLYSSGAGRCRVYRDEDGTPHVYTAWSHTIPAWSHAMSWPLFQDWQNTIEALIIEYEGGQLSVFAGFPEQLERARGRLDELQPHLPLFLDHMQNVPGLPEGTLVELIQDAAAAADDPVPPVKAAGARRAEVASPAGSVARALGVLVDFPELRSIRAVARKAECSHTTLSRSPRFQAAWRHVQRERSGSLAVGYIQREADRTRRGAVEAIDPDGSQ